MPYMSVAAIDAAIDHIAAIHPTLAKSIVLPEASVEGRGIKALQLAAGTSPDRRGVLFIGGVHARELVNPETLVELALRLCNAYASGSGVAFGPKAYDAQTVKLYLDALNIVILPMANPDGRNHCLVAGGDPMWRKNRSHHAGLACFGVDCNRNCAFLWSSGIGTSADSCSDVFKGPSAFSEPETRNVRWLIDSHPRIESMIDVHSYSELVLYPWGDDELQTSDPNQNFQNPAFDGQRGIVGTGYKEYIPADDLDDLRTLGARIRDGIAAVRGRIYTLQPSINLYPTSATWHDYAYSRQFVETGRRRILGYTVETAREFQPGDAEKAQVIAETSAGLMECLAQTLCPAESVQLLSERAFALDEMRAFRDQRLQASAMGRLADRVQRRHASEVIGLLLKDRRAMKAAQDALAVAGELLAAPESEMNAGQAAALAGALQALRSLGSPALKADLTQLQDKLGPLRGQSLQQMFPPAKVARPRVKPAPAKKVSAKPAARKLPKRRGG